MKFCSVRTIVANSHLAQDGDHLLELRGAGDERRRELGTRLATVVEAHIDAELTCTGNQERLDELVALLRRERLLRLLVLHHLERIEVPVPAQVAEQRVLVDELLATGAELAHVPLHVADQALALEDRDVGERDRAGERVAAEGDAVRERPLGLVEERLDHLGSGDERAERGIRGGDAFRDRHHVRLDSVARRAEPVAYAPEPADDLVGDEEHAVLVADLTHALEVALGRRDRARRVLDRLEHDRGDRLRALRADGRVDLVGAAQRAPRLVGAIRAAVAVGHRHPHASLEERLELRAKRRAAVDGERAHRRAVVRAPPRHELVAAWLAPQAVVLARYLERAFDRLRPAADEEDPSHVDRYEGGQLLGELDGRRRREADPVREEGQLADLLGCGIGDLGPRPVADVDAIESRQRVEIAPPFSVPDVATLCALDYERRVHRTREMAPEVIRRGGHTPGSTAASRLSAADRRRTM
jgi:hypothetical protein